MKDDFIVKKIGKKPKLTNPVLIEGLPGVGNVARIVVDFLIKKLKAKKFMEVYSYTFPNTVLMRKDHSIEMPKLEFYYYKRKKKKDIVFLIGDIQPTDEYDSYVFSDKILEIAKSLGVKEIITLGGISAASKENVVYGVHTDKKYIPKLKKIGVKFDRKGAIIIIGAAGLLLGLGELRKIKGFSLLAETDSKIGIGASKSIILILKNYFELKIKSEHIDKELKKIEVPIIKKKMKMAEKSKGPLTYIG